MNEHMESDEVDGGPVMFVSLVLLAVGFAAGLAASVLWGWL